MKGSDKCNDREPSKSMTQQCFSLCLCLCYNVVLSDDSVIINCKDDGSDDDKIKDNDDRTFWNLNNVNNV